MALHDHIIHFRPEGSTRALCGLDLDRWKERRTDDLEQMGCLACRMEAIRLGLLRRTRKNTAASQWKKHGL